jgi:hypothetical protein
MKELKQATLDVNWKYADDFKRVYVSNAFGMIGDSDYRLFAALVSPVMQENPSKVPTVTGDVKVELMLPFPVLKTLRDLLDEDVKLVERRFGQIIVPTSPDDRLVA